MDDDVISDLTKDDLQILLKVGFNTGNAVKFLRAFTAASPAPSCGGAAAAAPPASDVVAAAAAHAVSSLSLSPAAPRTFASSNFKREYDAAECPELQHQLFSSIHSFLTLLCNLYGGPAAAAKSLFHRLQGESFENPKELLSQIQVAATRIWTSTQKLEGVGVDKALNAEFCSLLNRALRDDAAELMPHLVVIVRAINALCIVRREEKSLKFPPNSLSHRGGALPAQHHAFYSVGKKYRVPMYLATSFDEDKAYEFW